MNIFFDVDNTIIGMDCSLRPGTREVFERLVADGHRLYVWSGNGISWAELDKHGLRVFVSAIFDKPTAEFHEALNLRGITPRPDFVVDDHGEIVSAFGGAWLHAYWRKEYPDDDLMRVYEIVCDCVRNGTSDHPYYVAKGG
jgi:hypothetical protein